MRFGIDIITADPKLKRCFEEDPAAPRDKVGEVDADWYEQALAAASRQAPSSAMRLK